MYIGKLNASISPRFTYADSARPFPPTEVNDGELLWKWNKIYDSAIDIIYELPRRCFVGAVSFSLSEESEVRSAEVLVDGVLSGSHYAETGKTFGGEHTLTVGTVGTVVTLRLGADLKNVALREPTILGAYHNGDADLWPVAKKINNGKKTVALGGIAPAADPDEAFVSEFLSSRLLEEIDQPFSEGGVTVRIEKTDSAELADEEFHLSVSEEGVSLKAKSRLALLYAADALLQLRRGNEFLTATVEDKPDKEFRGVHIGLPKLENFEFTRRLFRYVFIPLRYNAVIIEFAGGMRFDRRPEISEAWLRADRLAKEGKQPEMPHAGLGAEGTILEKDDVRRLVGFAKELGLEVIPEVQSLGHVQYLTYTYPEIAEIDPNAEQVKDLRAEDAKPNQFYHHSYCPSLEKSYEIIFDVIDEIVEVAEPQRFVHIGHDEIYQIGVCPRCQNTAPDVLYEKHVRALYEHIKAKGLRTMLWADMLIREKYATVAARDRLPRDIVALDFIWYFHLDTDTETALLDRGYSVAVGNLYSSHFPRYLTRMNREGMLGGQISMWVRTEENAIATIGKFYDMAYLSEMLWNAESYDERLRPVYTRIVGDAILPELREHLHGTYPKEKPMSAVIPLPDKGGEGVPAEILKRHADAVIADGETIRVGDRVDRLIFTHGATRQMARTSWLEILKMGEYRIKYADGSIETVELGYGTNVLVYNATYGRAMPQQYYRHFGYVGTWFADPVFDGKCADGRDLTLLAMPWDNPHPEKPVVSVSYVPDGDALAQLVLVEIRAERRAK